jgi:hypothetical protein
MAEFAIKNSHSNAASLPQGWIRTMKGALDWQVYRTRFLIRAKPLTEPLVFVDVLGREHCGRAGDYLVEFPNGVRRIAAREFFENVYVSMGPADDNWPALARGELSLQLRHAPPSRVN